MDSWSEEQREVLETAMRALRPDRDPQDTRAGRYLLRHLLQMPWRATGNLRYDVAEDFHHERVRHPHAVP